RGLLRITGVAGQVAGGDTAPEEYCRCERANTHETAEACFSSTCDRFDSFRDNVLLVHDSIPVETASSRLRDPTSRFDDGLQQDGCQGVASPLWISRKTNARARLRSPGTFAPLPVGAERSSTRHGSAAAAARRPRARLRGGPLRYGRAPDRAGRTRCRGQPPQSRSRRHRCSWRTSLGARLVPVASYHRAADRTSTREVR